MVSKSKGYSCPVLASAGINSYDSVKRNELCGSCPFPDCCLEKEARKRMARIIEVYTAGLIEDGIAVYYPRKVGGVS